MEKNTISQETELELIDDQPDEVKSDLRKFNKAEDQVNKALSFLSDITTIEDQAGVDNAMEVMKKASKVEKLIEEKRKQLVTPYNDEVKRINKYAKDLTEKIPPAIQKVKDQILAFHKGEEKKAKELRAEARKGQLTDMGFYLQDEQYEIKAGDESIIIHPNFIADMPDEGWTKYVTEVTGKLQAARDMQIAQLQKNSEGADFFGDVIEKEEIAAKVEDLKSQPVVAPVKSYSSFGNAKNNGLTRRWTFDITDISLVPREFLVIDEKIVKEAISAGERNIPGLRIYQSESITIR